MSDFPCSSRSKSSLLGGRTPFKLIQPPSSFIDRVNKVFNNKIFESTKRPIDKLLESDRLHSPYLSSRCDRLAGALYKLGLKSKRQVYSKGNLKHELAQIKIESLYKNRCKWTFDILKKEVLYKISYAKKQKTNEDAVLKQIIEESLQKYVIQLQSPPTSLLTKCEKCGHIGLNFYTTSTKERFSPRFLDKIRTLLPGTLKKSLSDVSTLPIADSFLMTPYADCSRDLSSNSSPDFCGNANKVPILPLKPKPQPRYSEEVLKNSPIQLICNSNLQNGVSKLQAIYITRMHRSFDIIFLSRAACYNREQSLTFEFTLEESKISSEQTLNGTFGEQNKTFEASSTQKNHYFTAEYENSWNRTQNAKTACKILYTRLDKLFYRRKVRGFYSLVDVMY
jgi:hypothetical protein